MKHESRILLLALMTGATGSIVSLLFIWTTTYSVSSKVTLTGLIVSLWLGFALHVRSVVAFPLRTVSNLIGALHEGDYALRARGACQDDALGEGHLGAERTGRFAARATSRRRRGDGPAA